MDFPEVIGYALAARLAAAVPQQAIAWAKSKGFDRVESYECAGGAKVHAALDLDGQVTEATHGRGGTVAGVVFFFRD